MKEIDFDKFIVRLRAEFHWSKIEDGSGSWSPGQCGFIIDKCLEEVNDVK